ncbi:hypothetical protein [Brevundimonas sp.]|uniref:hypothetical protein n=1 Tax=Brevundimonas sp. TaxID=1871086 RepID=UPI00261BCDDD|nr:hypothetical protein [Brevundimonas sp.]
MDIDDYTIIRGHPRHARHQAGLRPFEGWALDAAGVLDRACPNFLVHILGGSPKYRQAVFLALGMGILPNPQEFLMRCNGDACETQQWAGVQHEVAQALMASTPRQIASATLGEIPDGLAGCLARLGSQPMPHAGDYVRLVDLLTSTEPEMRLRAKTLLQVSRLDSDLLSAVLEIDPIALIPDIFRRLRCGLEARRLNQRLSAIRLVSSTATDEALRQSLEDRALNFSGSSFAQSWLDKADRPPVVCKALDDHPDFERVTGANAAQMGKDHQNCLGSQSHKLIDGTWGAWVWKPGPLIVCVTKGYLTSEAETVLPLLSGLYAPGNREVRREHARMVKDVLRPLGVICFTRCDPVEEVRLLTQGRFVDDEFEEFGFQ